MFNRTLRSYLTYIKETSPQTIHDGYFERPGTILLLQSDLHNWRKHETKREDRMKMKEYPSSACENVFSIEFPKRGISFAATHMLSPNDKRINQKGIKISNLTQLCEFELARDMQRLQDPSTIVVANGPIPSLIAQYYLESRPMAGLVMVDPFLVSFTKHQLQISAKYYHDHLLQHGKKLKDSDSVITHPEFQIIKGLMDDTQFHSNDPRILRIEPGSVPMLILYSSEYYRDHKESQQRDNSLTFQSHARNYAEVTAEYHSQDDNIFSCSIPTICLDDEDDTNGNNCDTYLENKIAKEIYDWIDEYDVL